MHVFHFSAWLISYIVLLSVFVCVHLNKSNRAGNHIIFEMNTMICQVYSFETIKCMMYREPSHSLFSQDIAQRLHINIGNFRNNILGQKFQYLTWCSTNPVDRKYKDYVYGRC